ncbi:MAG: hypothetical protein IGS39_01190 [Calothrix sp. C42_A2020_038]|nr:hypothetical protein [Calothrix sp. C42_A2020_038]
MLIHNCDFKNSVPTVDHLQRQIQIRKIQLKIARDSNMHFVAETLQHQLEELQDNSNFQALMSLID